MKEEKKRLEKLYNKYVLSILYEDFISIEEYKNYFDIIGDSQLTELISYILEYNDIQRSALKKILAKTETYRAAKKLANVLGRIDELIADIILERLDNIDFVKFINLLDINALSKRISIFEIFAKYNKVITIENWDKSRESLSSWYYDETDYQLTNMNDYEIKRDEYYQNNIRNGIFEPEKIAVSYFQTSLTEIKKFSKTYKIKNLYTMFDEINDTNRQLSFLRLAKANKNYFVNYKKQIKEKSINDLYTKINFNVIKNPEIITLNGQNFLLLIHRIKGLLQENITNKLMDNIQEWGSNYEENAYISCSLINQLYISLVSGDCLTIGFNNIEKNDILAMNTHDMCFLKKYVINQSEDIVSTYLPVDDLLQQSWPSYNEIVLRRFREKKAIMPDYLLAFDDIDELTEKAAKELKIPIYKIILEEYANLLIEELNKFKNNDIDKYNLFINKISMCRIDQDCPLRKYYTTILEKSKIKDERVLKLIKEPKGLK